MQNKHILLEKLKIISFKYLSNGLRKRNLVVFYSILEEMFSRTFIKKFQKK
jgi:hypothetical protein